ncbi:hypothetical protein JM84_2441 [Dokdonia sp. Hel_I_63]|uniref:DUF6575 domain-containing protein n=1 Tax=Dokdonia sp. Hel_I_63 TaxID=1249996 RepID=UPI001199D60B|nr:DUF6575 domain-containing protein [Dokdonia sp. Hel_I_63]TVZ23513.1 hypothetical protein JM84_2441 [Dokdonia sp. Hel_I_63]
MINLEKAIKVSKLDFELHKKGDILFYDGPFLSHFYDNSGDEFLMLWVDNDEKYNRWLIIPTDTYLLNLYLSKKYTLRELIFKNDSQIVYYVDINENLDYKRIYISSQKNIPEEYLPAKNSTFVDKYAEEYALNMKKEFSKVFKIHRNIKSHRTFRNFELKRNPNDIKVWKFKSQFNIENWFAPISIIYNNHSEIGIYKYLIHKSNDALINPITTDLYFNQLEIALNKTYLEYENHLPQLMRNMDVYNKLIYITIQVVKRNPNSKHSFDIWKKELSQEDKLMTEVQNILDEV